MSYIYPDLPDLDKFTFFALDFPGAQLYFRARKTKVRVRSRNNWKHFVCSLLRKQDSWLSFLMYSLRKILQWGCCSFRFNYLNIVWISKKKMFLKGQFLYFRNRRICWKDGTLLKINSTAEALTIMCRNFSEKILFKMPMERYL